MEQNHLRALIATCPTWFEDRIKEINNNMFTALGIGCPAHFIAGDLIQAITIASHGTMFWQRKLICPNSLPFAATT